MADHKNKQLRFDILGPLEVWSDGIRLRIGGAVHERVLAILLLEPGRVLPVSRFVESTWNDDPPTTASHQVRKAIADLRRRIPGGSDLILTDGPGYRVAVTDGQLDLTEFHALTREAGKAASEGRPGDAVEALRSALALWRGPVMSGLGGPVIDAAAAALEERRLAAAEQFFGLRMQCGEIHELVADLRALVAEYPLRETLRGQLMLALYRSARQAEALEEYGKVRELLVEELGVDPGPQLAKIYEDILRDSPELAAPESPAGPTTAANVPCTLPHDLVDFTGRDKELRQLLTYAREASDQGTQIIALDGMGGSGKTSLAVRAAHQLVNDYPDGQLHLDLRGYTPGEQPLPPGAALDTLLRALGTPGDQIPEDTAGRTARWRAMLTGKRCLLLLDNASGSDWILPLLPNSPGCLVIVTSRPRLVDLDGAEWISINMMQPEESATLVAQTLGARRVAAEPDAAAELALLCGHLPLALRLATARLRNRPRWTVQYMVDRLRNESRRLDELRSSERSVAATLRLSYQAMDERYRTALRILALHPGPLIDIHATAALLGSDIWEAERILELLLDVHLLNQPEIDLYTFHDLVRSFAHSLRGEQTAQEDGEAIDRLLDYYLTATETACAVLFPGRRHRPTGIVASTSEMPKLRSTDTSQEWFTREHNGLLAVVALADRRGADRHTVSLARNIAFQLSARGHLNEFWELGRLAVTAARRLGDLALLGVSLSNLGVACWKLGRFNEGIDVAQEGRDVAVLLGDRHTEAHSESTLGLLKSLLGRFPEALAHLEKAVAQQHELGAARAEVESLTILSALYEQWGRHRDAVDAARRAAALGQRLGHISIEMVALTDLAFAHVGLGEYEEAHRSLKRARELCDETRDPGHVAMVLAISADIHHRLGRPAEAANDAERALQRAQSSSSPLQQAKVENIIGRLRHRQKQFASAMALHTHAYKLASAINYRIEEAYALAGMAQAARGLGDPRASEEHGAAADALFASMGVPDDRRR